MALIGYARVSTVDQNPALQLEALELAGCARIFTETASGARDDRPQLQAALDYARAEDVLVVWRLDRLGQSLTHLVATVNELHDRHVGLRSLTEAIDTTTAGGRLTFHLFAAIAEFERELIRERTLAGLAAARASGRKGGKQRADRAKVATGLDLIAKGRTVSEAARIVGLGRSTLYRELKESA
jgi:DNA invertase Pin-like site-specific DNA recombinase